MTGMLDMNQLGYKLDIFEKELFIKIQYLMEKSGNNLQVLLDAKINKDDIKQ
jgi:hypothetical protein